MGQRSVLGSCRSGELISAAHALLQGSDVRPPASSVVPARSPLFRVFTCCYAESRWCWWVVLCFPIAPVPRVHSCYLSQLKQISTLTITPHFRVSVLELNLSDPFLNVKRGTLWVVTGPRPEAPMKVGVAVTTEQRVLGSRMQGQGSLCGRGGAVRSGSR